MAFFQSLIAYGVPAQVANAIATDSVDTVPTRSVSTGLTATGTTIADALQLTSLLNVITTAAASTGVKLPPVDSGFIGQSITVKNAGANTINVFPETAAVGFNRGALGTAVTLAAGAVGIYRRTTATNWES